MLHCDITFSVGSKLMNGEINRDRFYPYPTVCNMHNVVSLCIEHTSKVGIYACKRVLYIVLDVKLCTRHIDSLKHLTQYSNPYVYESNKYDSEYRQYVLNLSLIHI